MPVVLRRVAVGIVFCTLCVLTSACSPQANAGPSSVFTLDAGTKASADASSLRADSAVVDGAQQGVLAPDQTVPASPSETCDAGACGAHDAKLSGTVSGLVGSGLVLSSDSGERLPIEANGAFSFRTLLPTRAAYAVTVSAAPQTPQQTCTVMHGTGVASGVDISDLKVVCTVNPFRLSAHVTGLTGAGLELSAQAGDVFAVASAGVTTFPFPLPDGYAYVVSVARQPTQPNQRCYVTQGVGVLHADASVEVTCDLLSGLRIAEVGACPYANSACWFELMNGSNTDEPLDDYRVRTSALSANAFSADRVFDLPNVTIPAGATVVLQAKTKTAQPDGSNIFHFADGTIMPWWPSSGFVELLNPRGETEDFVRFGDSKVEPTTGGTWGGGNVAALPTGQSGYGYSLAHTRATRGVSSAADWRLSSFATFAGVNDIASDVDADLDGVPDVAEVPGGTFAGLDLYAMGARLAQRDVFVEIDRMDSSDPALSPRRAALDKLQAVFEKRGIHVHFDVGDLFVQSFDASAYNLGGGNKVPFAKAVGFAPNEPGISDLYGYKASQMAGARRSLFYYMLFAWSQEADGSGGSSGVGEVSGNDTIITLGGFSLNASNSLQRNVLANYQAATMMHELGHNLGLRHGGGDSRNLKPNYVSVMNYLYSPIGLPTIGDAEGDRFDLFTGCSLASVVQLTNPPTGEPTAFVLDYSDGLGEDLDEHSLLERAGLGRSNSRAVDFNCNHKTNDSAYSRDLNNDGVLEVLDDNDDWGKLEFIFRRTAAGDQNGRALRVIGGVRTHGDALTEDEHHELDPPCPALPIN
jgi:hypothetical protein